MTTSGRFCSFGGCSDGAYREYAKEFIKGQLVPNIPAGPEALVFHVKPGEAKFGYGQSRPARYRKARRGRDLKVCCYKRTSSSEWTVLPT